MTHPKPETGSDQHRFPWRRYWFPRGVEIDLLTDGFLPDPDSLWSADLMGQARELRDLSEERLVILLGGAGMGKSTMLKETVSQDPLATFHDLAEYSSRTDLYDAFDRDPRMRTWREGEGSLSLFLDSVDESPMNAAALRGALVSYFKNLEADLQRLRLRIAGREVEFPGTLESELLTLFGADQPQPVVYKLAPLRREDVSLAAEQREIEARRFLAEVERVEAVPFARVPNSLLLLLGLFADEEQLPASRTELFEKGSRHLCQELNRSRQDANMAGDLSADQRLAVARRVAAAVIFGNRHGVWTDPDRGDVPAGVMQLSELLGLQEQAGNQSFDIDEDAIEECLATALFTAGGDGSVRFSHRTFAEYLAAQYLLVHDVPDKRVLNLLQHPQDPASRLVPQLHGTAAWLASARPDILNSIVLQDPQVLLQADEAHLDETERAGIVEGLLASLADGDLPGNYVGLFQSVYHRLCHPDLPEQLRPVLQDKSLHINARSAAIEVAYECSVTDLSDELLDIALDQEEDITIRISAADAVVHFGDTVQKERLRSLALSQAGEDPEDELKAIGLHALWPELIGISELLKIIGPPKKDGLFSRYATFLQRHLAAGLELEDIPYVLRWLGENKELTVSQKFVWDEMVESILLRAWEYLDSPGILEPLAALILRRYAAGKNFGSSLQNRGYEQIMQQEPKERRGIVSWIIENAQFDIWDLHYLVKNNQPLLTPEDFIWVSECYYASNPNRRPYWMELLGLLIDPQDQAQMRTLHDIYEEQPEVDESGAGEAVQRVPFAYLFDAVELGSRIAELQKQNYEEDIAAQARQAESEARLLPENLLPRVRKHLEDFKDGKNQALGFLLWELAAINVNSGLSRTNLDVAQYPTWRLLSKELQEDIRVAAVQYLENTLPEEEVTYFSLHTPARACFMLLSTEAPGKLRALDAAIWERWQASVLFAFSDQIDWQSPTAKALVLLALECNPAAFLENMREQLHSEDKRLKDLYILRRVEHIDDPALNKCLLSELTDRDWRWSSLYTLLAYLLHREVPEARQYAEAILQNKGDGDEAQQGQVVAAMQALLFATEDGGWGQIWPRMEVDRDFAALFIRTIAREWSGRLASVAPRLAEDEILPLYRLLTDLFPPEEDEDRSTDGILLEWPVERDANIWRSSLLQELSRRSTPEAIAALEQIKQEFPEHTVLANYLHTANTRLMAQSWEVPAVPDLLALIYSHHGRLVRSEAELLDAVLDALDRYHARLHGKNSTVNFLWPKMPGGGQIVRPVEEEQFSDHIADFLDQDLNQRGIVFGREVEIRARRGERKGQVPDILVRAVIEEGQAYGAVEVIIEVKCCWHSKVKTAMQSQLVDRYLKNNDQTKSGIYLIGHFASEHWEEGQPRTACERLNVLKTKEDFCAQARKLSAQGYEVRAVIIDASLNR